MGIGLDNTNVNIGKRTPIKSGTCQKNDNITMAGCSLLYIL